MHCRYLIILAFTSTSYARFRHTSTVVDRAIYYIGGLESAQPATFAQPVLRLNVSTSFDVSQPPFQPVETGDAPRIALHAAVRASTDTILLYGGITQSPSDSAFLAFTTTNNSFSNVSTSIPKRYEASMATYNSVAYVFGGLSDANATTQASNALHTLRMWDNTLNTVQNDQNRPAERWDHASVAWADGRVVVLGGVTRTNDTTWSLMGLDTIHLYNPTTNAWTNVTTTGTIPKPRRAFSAAVWENKIIVYGGSDNNFTHYHDDVAILDMQSTTWSVPDIIRDANTPVGRYGHSMDLISSKDMLVSFGMTSSGVDSRIYLLDMREWRFVASYSVGSSDPVGTIIGIVVGSVFALFFLVLGGLFLYHRVIKPRYYPQEKKPPPPVVVRMGPTVTIGGTVRDPLHPAVRAPNRHTKPMSPESALFSPSAFNSIVVPNDSTSIASSLPMPPAAHYPSVPVPNAVSPSYLDSSMIHRVSHEDSLHSMDSASALMEK
jgi:hypothetical protein